MLKESLKTYLTGLPQTVKPEYSSNAVVCEIQLEDIIEVAVDLARDKWLPLKMITATDERTDNGCFKIWYIFGVPEQSAYIVLVTKLEDGEEFPALTPILAEAWNYERKIKTFFGLKPVGHPDSRPIILHENWPTDLFPLRKDFKLKTRPETVKGEYKFLQVEGEGIYEIPVGPIHAGIIEPGHFRFSVAGEEIVNLEAKLGWVHKGSEKLFESLSMTDKLRLSEKISGDSSFHHSLAFCQAVEELAGVSITKQAKYLRVVFAELERIANHVGDIGAMMLDSGFNFGGSNGARLREQMLRINEKLTGSRFLRGVNTFGGVTKGITEQVNIELRSELESIFKDFEEVIAIAENSNGLQNRLHTTGTISTGMAKFKGIMGVPARAAGVEVDTRVDFPYAAYSDLGFDKIEVEKTGDVHARFDVRVKEIRASMTLIQKALKELAEFPGEQEKSLSVKVDTSALKKNALVINTVEGWRGEIMYFVTTDSKGMITRVYPRDPSFVNWGVLGDAGLGNVVPDFPLINKSFNLSYTGNDL